ncbi:polysaccharide biosynthesis/export family protein [Mucilaginibacter sp. UYCu711]|uniref:polysaccharide biosynthesis/export family protein n=1 Tax=Mucilaginibacter sp. UYCu711 TaxID=3156339 RepID=UPI003D247E36
MLLEQKSFTPDTTLSKSSTNISNYRIKPQDILQIINVQNSKNLIDLTAGAPGVNAAPISQQGESYQVEEDGTIALTGIGRVPVAGMTRVEARSYIENLYRKTLKDPLFELKITNLKVLLFGELKGTTPISLTHDNTTLMEVIGEAGGLTEKADSRNVKIIRGGQKYPKTEVIDLTDIKTLTDPRIIMQNNDIVVVSQNKRAIRAERLQDISTIASPVLLILNTVLIVLSLTRR